METLNLRAEGNKLLHDTMKQLVTVSSGAILIIIALLEKLFSVPRFRALVAVSLGCFLLCIIFGLLMMRTISLKMGAGYAQESSERFQKKENFLYPAASWSFGLGILILIVFFLVNLFRDKLFPAGILTL